MFTVYIANDCPYPSPLELATPNLEENLPQNIYQSLIHFKEEDYFAHDDPWAESNIY